MEKAMIRTMDPKTPQSSLARQNVLFLCAANSARSQMAEAFLRHYAGGSFDVFSAGARPAGIHPLTTEVMNEVGLDLRDQRSKGIAELLGKLTVHHAVIVCQEVEPDCPTTWPFALSLARWPFENPAAGEGSTTELLPRFRAVRDRIDAKIRDWLQELGISSAHFAAASHFAAPSSRC
jgi:arsenate reductase